MHQHQPICGISIVWENLGTTGNKDHQRKRVRNILIHLEIIIYAVMSTRFNKASSLLSSWTKFIVAHCTLIRHVLFSLSGQLIYNERILRLNIHIMCLIEIYVLKLFSEIKRRTSVSQKRVNLSYHCHYRISKSFQVNCFSNCLTVRSCHNNIL